jgi:hypothetical protein
MAETAEKKPTVMFRIIKAAVQFFYPKTQVLGLEHLPQEPCIVVGNHAQLNGPIVGELYFPGPKKIWTAGQMMVWKEVPAYAFQDFWSQKPRWSHWYFRLVSYLITPLSVCVFNNASTIPVYHDMRLMTTFRTTLEALQAGENIIIFPEHDVKHNHIVYEFQDKFIDVAKLYYKKTGKALQFVPMYVAPKLKQTVLGAPVTFDPTADIKAERVRIAHALMEGVTDLACALPRHTVVPYRNMAKHLYPTNIPQEATHEITRR